MALAVGIGVAKAACVLLPAAVAGVVGSASYAFLSGRYYKEPVNCQDSGKDRMRKENLIKFTKKLAQQMGIVNSETTELTFIEDSNPAFTGSNLFPNSRKIIFFPDSLAKNPKKIKLAMVIICNKLFFIKDNMPMWEFVVPLISSIFAFTLAFYLAPLAVFPIIPLTYFITLYGVEELGILYEFKKTKLFFNEQKNAELLSNC